MRPSRSWRTCADSDRLSLHPGHIRVSQHSEVEPVAAAGHVLNHQVGIPLVQLGKQSIECLHMSEAAVSGPVPVTRCVLQFSQKLLSHLM